MITWNKYYPEFRKEEFDCKCGCGTNSMQEEHLERLLKARRIAGIPFHITSGSRCLSHNREVGGTSMSDHLMGGGSDIAVDSSPNRYKIVVALLEAGFKRIGIGKSFVHAGDSVSNPSNVLWLY